MRSGVAASVLFIACSLSQVGCTWSPAKQSWPIPPRAIVEYPAPNLDPHPGQFEQLSNAIKHAKGFRELVVSKSVDRAEMDWATSDFTSLGVIGAVAGALADQTGLLNTGAGMSVLGVSARDRYQYGNQQAAYAGAREVLDCTLTHIQSTNDKEIEWGMSQGESPEVAEAASELPVAVVESTQKVKESLITRLLSIKSEPIKASEFKAAYRAQVQAFEEQERASRALLQQTQNDRQLLARFSTLALAPQVTEKARLDRLLMEDKLVPIHLREQVGVKLVGMRAKLTACAAGY